MWDKLRGRLWRWRGIFIVVPSVTATVLLLRVLGLLELVELTALDQFFQLRPAESVDSRIVIVEMNESDVQELGDSLSDWQMVRLLNRIKQQQPAGIGLDFYRDLPVPPGYAELKDRVKSTEAVANNPLKLMLGGYAELEKVMKSTPNLIGVQKVGHPPVNPPPALKAKDQIGINDMQRDRDGKVRRIFFFGGDGLFSFSWKMAYLYLQKHNISVELVNNDLIQLGSVQLHRFAANDGGYVRADAQGFQVMINYRAGGLGKPQSFPTVSMVNVLAGNIPPDLFRDKLVLIGATAESKKDTFLTPYSTNLLQDTVPMPGVMIHAHAASQFLSGVLEGRPFIRTWNEPLEIGWILSWAVIGAVLSWQQQAGGHVKKRVPWTVITLLLVAGSLIGGGYLAFLGGWWIPVVPALLALAGSSLGVTVYIAQSAKEIRKVFGRFITDEIVSNLLENPEGLKLGGERRKITILVSDIRGFTASSERLPPEEVVRIINLYLGYMTDIITRYQGTIDEFMGDGILVLFGAPTVRENDADRAVACAIAMQQAMPSVNEKMQELGLPKLEMGIGINTGEVVVGNIGSEKRSKYGVVGDQVNLTYRVEGYTVGGQILASESTIQALSSDVITDEEREVQPKGVHKPIMIYEVIGIKGEYDLQLTKQDELSFPVTPPLMLQYATLDGKQINREQVVGQLVQISQREAEICLDPADHHDLPEPLTNLKMNLAIPENESASEEDVYAKVLEKPATSSSFYIRFTNRPPAVDAYLNNLYNSLLSISKSRVETK
jgi:adenylate cyclase